MTSAPGANPSEFELPVVPGRRWYLGVDTSLPSPDDMPDPDTEPEVLGAARRVEGRTVVVLVNRT